MKKVQDALGKLPQRWRFSLHNIVGHPVSEVLFLVGLEKAGDFVHDVTLPTHEPGTGRG